MAENPKTPESPDCIIIEEKSFPATPGQSLINNVKQENTTSTSTANDTMKGQLDSNNHQTQISSKGGFTVLQGGLPNMLSCLNGPLFVNTSGIGTTVPTPIMPLLGTGSISQKGTVQAVAPNILSKPKNKSAASFPGFSSQAVMQKPNEALPIVNVVQQTDAISGAIQPGDAVFLQDTDNPNQKRLIKVTQQIVPGYIMRNATGQTSIAIQGNPSGVFDPAKLNISVNKSNINPAFIPTISNPLIKSSGIKDMVVDLTEDENETTETTKDTHPNASKPQTSSNGKQQIAKDTTSKDTHPKISKPQEASNGKQQIANHITSKVSDGKAVEGVLKLKEIFPTLPVNEILQKDVEKTDKDSSNNTRPSTVAVKSSSTSFYKSLLQKDSSNHTRASTVAVTSSTDSNKPGLKIDSDEKYKAGLLKTLFPSLPIELNQQGHIEKTDKDSSNTTTPAVAISSSTDSNKSEGKTDTDSNHTATPVSTASITVKNKTEENSEKDNENDFDDIFEMECYDDDDEDDDDDTDGDTDILSESEENTSVTTSQETSVKTTDSVKGSDISNKYGEKQLNSVKPIVEKAVDNTELINLLGSSGSEDKNKSISRKTDNVVQSVITTNVQDTRDTARNSEKTLKSKTGCKKRKPYDSFSSSDTDYDENDINYVPRETRSKTSALKESNKSDDKQSSKSDSIVSRVNDSSDGAKENIDTGKDSVIPGTSVVTEDNLQSTSESMGKEKRNADKDKSNRKAIVTEKEGFPKSTTPKSHEEIDSTSDKTAKVVGEISRNEQFGHEDDDHDSNDVQDKEEDEVGGVGTEGQSSKVDEGQNHTEGQNKDVKKTRVRAPVLPDFPSSDDDSTPGDKNDKNTNKAKEKNLNSSKVSKGTEKEKVQESEIPNDNLQENRDFAAISGDENEDYVNDDFDNAGSKRGSGKDDLRDDVPETSKTSDKQVRQLEAQGSKVSEKKLKSNKARDSVKDSDESDDSSKNKTYGKSSRGRGRPNRLEKVRAGDTSDADTDGSRRSDSKNVKKKYKSSKSSKTSKTDNETDDGRKTGDDKKQRRGPGRKKNVKVTDDGESDSETDGSRKSKAKNIENKKKSDKDKTVEKSGSVTNEAKTKEINRDQRPGPKCSKLRKEKVLTGSDLDRSNRPGPKSSKLRKEKVVSNENSDRRYRPGPKCSKSRKEMDEKDDDTDRSKRSETRTAKKKYKSYKDIDSDTDSSRISETRRKKTSNYRKSKSNKPSQDSSEDEDSDYEKRKKSSRKKSKPQRGDSSDSDGSVQSNITVTSRTSKVSEKSKSSGAKSHTYRYIPSLTMKPGEEITAVTTDTFATDELCKKQKDLLLSSCFVCGKLFADVSYMWQHIAQKHSYYINPEKFSCTHCGELYKTLYSLLSHELKQHAFAFACQFCGLKTCSEEERLNHAFSVHLKPEVFVCNFCHKDFRTVSAAEVHAKNTHQKSDGWLECLKCHYCKDLFIKPFSLFNHVLKDHWELFTFLCKSCGQLFHSMLSLRRHRSNKDHGLDGSYVPTDEDSYIIKFLLPSHASKVNSYKEEMEQITSSPEEIVKSKPKQSSKKALIGPKSKVQSSINTIIVDHYELDKVVGDSHDDDIVCYSPRELPRRSIPVSEVSANRKVEKVVENTAVQDSKSIPAIEKEKRTTASGSRESESAKMTVSGSEESGSEDNVEKIKKSGKIKTKGNKSGKKTNVEMKSTDKTLSILENSELTESFEQVIGRLTSINVDTSEIDSLGSTNEKLERLIGQLVMRKMSQEAKRLMAKGGDNDDEESDGDKPGHSKSSKKRKHASSTESSSASDNDDSKRSSKTVTKKSRKLNRSKSPASDDNSNNDNDEDDDSKKSRKASSKKSGKRNCSKSLSSDSSDDNRKNDKRKRGKSSGRKYNRIVSTSSTNDNDSETEVAKSSKRSKRKISSDLSDESEKEEGPKDGKKKKKSGKAAVDKKRGKKTSPGPRNRKQATPESSDMSDLDDDVEVTEVDSSTDNFYESDISDETPKPKRYTRAAAQEQTKKRGRGRPKKRSFPKKVQSDKSESDHSDGEMSDEKRGRGRPKKRSFSKKMQSDKSESDHSDGEMSDESSSSKTKSKSGQTSNKKNLSSERTSARLKGLPPEVITEEMLPANSEKTVRKPTTKKGKNTSVESVPLPSPISAKEAKKTMASFPAPKVILERSIPASEIRKLSSVSPMKTTVPSGKKNDKSSTRVVETYLDPIDGVFKEREIEDDDSENEYSDVDDDSDHDDGLPGSIASRIHHGSPQDSLMMDCENVKPEHDRNVDEITEETVVNTTPEEIDIGDIPALVAGKHPPVIKKEPGVHSKSKNASASQNSSQGTIKVKKEPVESGTSESAVQTKLKLVQVFSLPGMDKNASIQKPESVSQTSTSGSQANVSQHIQPEDRKLPIAATSVAASHTQTTPAQASAPMIRKPVDKPHVVHMKEKGVNEIREGQSVNQVGSSPNLNQHSVASILAATASGASNVVGTMSNVMGSTPSHKDVVDGVKNSNSSSRASPGVKNPATPNPATQKSIPQQTKPADQQAKIVGSSAQALPVVTENYLSTSGGVALYTKDRIQTITNQYLAKMYQQQRQNLIQGQQKRDSTGSGSASQPSDSQQPVTSHTVSGRTNQASDNQNTSSAATYINTDVGPTKAKIVNCTGSTLPTNIIEDIKAQLIENRKKKLTSGTQVGPLPDDLSVLIESELKSYLKGQSVQGQSVQGQSVQGSNMQGSKATVKDCKPPSTEFRVHGNVSQSRAGTSSNVSSATQFKNWPSATQNTGASQLSSSNYSGSSQTRFQGVQNTVAPPVRPSVPQYPGLPKSTAGQHSQYYLGGYGQAMAHQQSNIAQPQLVPTQSYSTIPSAQMQSTSHPSAIPQMYFGSSSNSLPSATGHNPVLGSHRGIGPHVQQPVQQPFAVNQARPIMGQHGIRSQQFSAPQQSMPRVNYIPPTMGQYGNIPPTMGQYGNIPPTMGQAGNVPPTMGQSGNVPPTMGQSGLQTAYQSTPQQLPQHSVNNFLGQVNPAVAQSQTWNKAPQDEASLLQGYYE